MIRRLRIRRWVRAVLLPAALVAVVPSVQWCPVGWDQVHAALMGRCAAGGERPIPECPATWGPRAAPGACSAGCAASGDAPACRTMSCAPSAALPARSGGRAYCLSDAAGGRALRGHAPEVSRVALLLAVLDVRLAPPSPTPAPRRATFQAEARPPTESAAAPPPVRGPPAHA